MSVQTGSAAPSAAIGSDAEAYPPGADRWRRAPGGSSARSLVPFAELAGIEDGSETGIAITGRGWQRMIAGDLEPQRGRRFSVWLMGSPDGKRTGAVVSDQRPAH